MEYYFELQEQQVIFWPLLYRTVESKRHEPWVEEWGNDMQ